MIDTFTVSLTVTGPGGFDIKVKENHIIVTSPTNVKNVERLRKIPTDYKLFQNYPNPFNPTTNINIALPKVSDVKISIFNVSGNIVKTINKNKMTAGLHSIVWNAYNLPSGTYFIKFITKDFIKVQKCVLLK